VTPQARRGVLDQFERHHEVEVVLTRARDDATGLAAAAVADGADAVVVHGGDGTLNEAACALVGTGVALVALPGGGTNVFCRTIGLPDDATLAAALQADALRRGNLRRIGVGSLDGGDPGAAAPPRPFLLHTGVGWDAALVSIVERHHRWKRRLNHALFVAAGLRTFTGAYDRRRPHLDLELDGARVDGVYFALVMNSDPYTFVGRRPFVVDPANGAGAPFTVVALRSMRVRHFLPVMVQALRGGGLSARPWLTVSHQAHDVVLRRRTTMPYQLDGDHLGDAGELHLVWRPDALSVVVPAQPGQLAQVR
jgi:diacylglycerol kinase family enzyme